MFKFYNYAIQAYNYAHYYALQEIFDSGICIIFVCADRAEYF